jgi:geranylgeranyl reductase family protein
MDIDIIGAGPAGNYTAYLLAKKGHRVNVFEKDPSIGKPVQCTGILSDYFTTIMKPSPEFVENTVTRTRIYAPNGRFVETEIKKNYVVCRVKFDNYLADMAKSAGAKYHLNSSFNGFEKKGKRYLSRINSNGTQIISESDILIGADGPLSPVAKSAGLFNDRRFVIGTQIEAKLKNDNVVEFYPYIGCYAWIVPKNTKVVRIGIAAYNDNISIFKKFVKQKLGENYSSLTLENQSGVIPIFNPKVRAQKDNIYLNGDSATFVKATTGGGINQSLKGAEILADAIENKKNYDKEWRKKMFKNLHSHLIVHKMMQKFSENDWNSLIDTFSQEKMKKILCGQSRDRLIPMLAKIALASPALVKYTRYFPWEELGNFSEFDFSPS